MELKDIDKLSNYKNDVIYKYVIKETNNSFITFAYEPSEDLMMKISSKERFIIKSFYVQKKKDIMTLDFIKLKKNKDQWEGEKISFGDFNFSKLREFLTILNGLNLNNSEKSKIFLDKDVDISSLIAILKTEQGKNLLKQISNQPILLEDIYALGRKKEQLAIFHKLLYEFDSYEDQYIADNPDLKKKGEENIWQHYFERNTWIFGHGLNYQFLHKVEAKLETTTAANSHGANKGHRMDGVMRTNAIISQYVFIEIKKPTDKLVEDESYRSGCWPVTKDVSDAVSQVQSAVFDFIKEKPMKVEQKTNYLNTGDFIYNVTRKSVLIIGKLADIVEHDGKIISFLLYRDNLKYPEIITYDELYERAKCIVETISHKQKNYE